MDEKKTKGPPLHRIVLILCVLCIYAGLCLIVLSPMLAFLVHRKYLTGIGLALFTSGIIIGTLMTKIRWSFVEVLRVVLFLTTIIGYVWELGSLWWVSLVGLLAFEAVVWKDKIVRGIKDFL
jgi:hypothetical protein